MKSFLAAVPFVAIFGLLAMLGVALNSPGCGTPPPTGMDASAEAGDASGQ